MLVLSFLGSQGWSQTMISLPHLFKFFLYVVIFVAYMFSTLNASSMRAITLSFSITMLSLMFNNIRHIVGSQYVFAKLVSERIVLSLSWLVQVPWKLLGLGDSEILSQRESKRGIKISMWLSWKYLGFSWHKALFSHLGDLCRYRHCFQRSSVAISISHLHVIVDEKHKAIIVESTLCQEAPSCSLPSLCMEKRGQCRLLCKLLPTLLFEKGSFTEPGTHQYR